jgi:hypothetical protein
MFQAIWLDGGLGRCCMLLALGAGFNATCTHVRLHCMHHTCLGVRVGCYMFATCMWVLGMAPPQPIADSVGHPKGMKRLCHARMARVVG